MRGDLGTTDRMARLADRLATLRQQLVPGVLVGAVRVADDLELSLVHLAVLFRLRDRGQLSVQQVAELIGGSKSKASRVVDHLVVRGLVDRRDDDRDRRSRQLTMATAGRELLATFEHSVTEAQFRRIQRLSPEEIDLVIHAIDLMASTDPDGDHQP